MTRIEWDKIGERTFHSGLDRGVLYPIGKPGVAWNGLVSVNESSEGKGFTPLYQDGIKYFNEQPNEEFKATIEAYTYPDEFEQITGHQSDGTGLYFNQQYREQFGFSYRSFIGNDVSASPEHYKIHLVYNATVLPETTNRTTYSEVMDPDMLSWEISTVPSIISGRKPTSTFTVDSKETDAVTLSKIEGILYGTSDSSPRLPSITELVDIFDAWPFFEIAENFTAGINRLIVRGRKDLKGDLYDGIFKIPPQSRLIGSSVTGIYSMEGL